MTEQYVKQYLLSFPEAIEDYPFSANVSVFKIEDKMFALLSHGWWKGCDCVAKLNLKCDPDEALMLRDTFEAIVPGYHMNKKHWNTVVLDGSVPEEYIKRMINASFSLVVNNLAKAACKQLILSYGITDIYR